MANVAAPGRFVRDRSGVRGSLDQLGVECDSVEWREAGEPGREPSVQKHCRAGVRGWAARLAPAACVRGGTLLRRGVGAGIGGNGRGAAVGWSTRRMFARMAVAVCGTCAWCAEEAHTIPYVPSASSEGYAGLVRIESRSPRSGEVRVVAVDDAGQRVEAGRLTLDAGAAIEFETGAMESGDASTGLTGTGPGQGDWRLELSTELDIEARAYARSEGFVTALHDAVLLSGEVELPLFNPGGDARRSVLRLANARGEPAAVSVRGVDDAGRAGGPVTAELGPWEARSYAASELESGSAAGLTGSLGDGDGRWRLTLSADRGSAYATNLLLDGSGVLSSVPGGMSRGGFHRVPLFPSASDGEGRRGLVRVVNRSADSAEVGIDAFDATDRAYEELRLALEAESSAEFDATDLEQGNAEKGLTGSTGPGEGDWWLELSSASDIEVLSYVDTASGPLSAVRGTAGVETATGMRYEAVLLSGAAVELRLLNAGGAAVEVSVSGTDDAGAPGGQVELTLAPWVARTLTWGMLSEGESGLRGALGAGTGSWRLSLESDGEIDVLSLVRGAGGMLSDVSRRGRPAGAPPRTDVIDATAAGADLVAAVGAPAGALAPGEVFTLRATVRNAGGVAAPATTLRYYRSSDAAITTADTEVETTAVAALARAGAVATSLALNAPSEPGTYYYGACVDAVPEERNTSNNCSAAIAVTVEARPDLAVAVAVPDGGVAPGGSLNLRATVRNVGDAASAATTLRYYRSSDASISTSDAEVGTDAVGALAAGADGAGSLTLNAPTTRGTYYYGACADAVPEERNTSNNCSAAAMVTVRVPPDLAVTATLSESAVEPEESFRLAARVSNQGRGDAPATTLRYYRSEDGTIAPSDTGLGADGVAALAAGGAETLSRELAAPSEPGTYYYGACADAVADESDTSNNCSAAAMVTVRVPPDLAVTATLSESAVEPEESFRLAARVSNQGRGDAPPTMLRYYRSEDGTIVPSDTGLGADGVAALAAGGFETLSRELAAPSEPGTYYYGACADAVADESDTSNNCSAAAMVTVRVPPDLAVTATLSESAVEPEESFRLAARVSNQGRGDAPATMLRYYRSEDGTIAPSDTGLGADGVAALAAGGSETLSRELAAPSEPGTYYYGACADAVADESDTSNNCSAAAMVTVRVPPDLAVTATLSESAVEPEESFRLAARVSNQGRGDAPATMLRYYRSEDGTIAPSDTGLGADGVAALAAGGSETLSRELAAPSEPGTYYYGACADAVADESDTSNNCSAAAMVTVRVPPDLAVTATLSESAVEPEESFGLAARVSNQGRGDAPAATLRYYRSSDASISTSDAEVGTDAVGALAAGADGAGSLTLNAPTTPGTYYYGACVDAVADETNTANNCSAAVALTVREPPPGPDLVVTAMLSDAVVDPGETFSLETGVRNRGGAASAATTLRYYRSSDASISTSDAEVGTDAVGALAAGADGAGSLTLNAPTTPGTYYYGACVDAVADETNTANNCSAAVALTVREPPPGPDLVVTAMLSDAVVDPGETFSLETGVRNRGGAASAATTLRYYRSSDASISTSDAEVGTDAVGALAAGTDGAGSLTLNAPTTPGTYYYGACVDAVADESDTSNNCSSPATLDVRRLIGPNLIITVFSAYGAASCRPNSYRTEVRIQNDGTAHFYGLTTARYYRSTDPEDVSEDDELSNFRVGYLGTLKARADRNSGLTSERGFGRCWPKPSEPGTYYHSFCLDPVPDELNTEDNCTDPPIVVRIDG